MKIDPARSALLVVDVQNDFCPGGTLAVPQGDEVVSVINRLLGQFAHIVATQDWHPADHVSFASNWQGRKPYETVEVKGLTQVLWPAHCVQGTAGAAFHPLLRSDAANLILRKGMHRDLDSYSALFENDHQSSTGLDGWLRGLKLSWLYITGLATDYCVFYTALDALRLGYDVVLVEDALRGVDHPAGNVDRTLAELRAKGCRFVRSAEVE